MGLDLSTDVVPENMRFQFFIECIQRQLDIFWEYGEPIGVPKEFNARIKSFDLGSVRICEIRSSSFSMRKAKAFDCENVLIGFQDEGELYIKHGDEQYSCSKGDAFLYAPNKMTEFMAVQGIDDDYKLRLIAVPHKLIQREFGCSNFTRPVTVPMRGGVNAAFLDVISTFFRNSSSIESDAKTPIIVEHLTNSLLNSLSAVMYCMPTNKLASVGLQDIQRNIVKSFIKENLRTELNLQVISKAVKLSPRYVHNLFASEPKTLMKWVLDERLDRCCRELISCSATRSIKEIAYSWGFKGQANFSRVFKKRYGMSAIEYRALHGITNLADQNIANASFNHLEPRM